MAQELKDSQGKAEARPGPDARASTPQDPLPRLIECTGVVFSTIMKSVSDAVATAALASDRTGVTALEAVSGIVRLALRGSPGAGSEFIMAAKAIVLGAIWGSGARDSEALKVLAHTTRSVIRQTIAMNGDVGDAVTGLVRGAIVAANHMGVDPAKAAWAASGAAIEEAYQISATSARRICTALKQNISGIKVATPARSKSRVESPRLAGKP